MLRYSRRFMCKAGAASAAGATGTSANAFAAADGATKSHLEPVPEHVEEKVSSNLQDELPPLPDPPRHTPLPFFMKGRRWEKSSEYYIPHCAPGHPDFLAARLNSGSSDTEWMWLKFLCFICVMATAGTTAYGYFFAEQAKYFKDEPWSPSSFRN